MQIIGVRVKRSVVLGAAQTTLLETEELKTRTDEEVSKLTSRLFENGGRHALASGLAQAAALITDDELLISPAEFEAIAEHIPEWAKEEKPPEFVPEATPEGELDNAPGA